MHFCSLKFQNLVQKIEIEGGRSFRARTVYGEDLTDRKLQYFI